ncbi:gluconate 5-dehydrogenase [Aspergillus nomiae NRRL 13137]|uniref:Gluconate 5-dehydrogenase n=1 Tax=Aspergillus nomiae NRRL (strain ATCC 15546 / NRRL 13137 / CBS 260.88 / M93) TaxID=1509407 RepID=A0A0L1JHI2_ASPN3|nr:gluconate 5-dehydrogenase [Aspergillus nomiae NRRL 13137]KNG91224.1 gluconate 5-dehydrogenase [Aspergillus nomiae NRRL 13137]
MARLLNKEGAHIVCADLSPTARSQVPDEVEIATHDAIIKAGGRAIYIETDVGDARQMERAVQTAVAEFGRLDILVNNAGVSTDCRNPARIHETDEHVWDTTLRVNTKSVFLGCKYALAQMLKQEPHSSGDRGWVINIASVWGVVGGLGAPAYCASKGAVVNCTRQMALDYAPDRIHVNAICPGAIYTAMVRDVEETSPSQFENIRRMQPFRGLGQPDEIARMAVVLASDDASLVTGVSLPVDGGYTAH